jgi:hypothetical protein
MKRCFLPVMAMAVPAFFLVCGPSQSPYSNPADAKILIDQSLRSLDTLHDSLTAFSTVQCTVELYLPKLIDSFYVHVSTNGKDSVVTSGAVAGTQITFPFTVAAPGIYGLKVVVVKTNDSTDSISRTITVYSSLSAQAAFVLPVRDSLVVRREYACSLAVTHAELADSVVARLMYSTMDTTIAHVKASAGVVFKFTVPAAGAFSIRAVVTMYGGRRDSVTKNMVGYTLSPVVQPDSLSHTVFLPADSFTFKFTVTDPDSNVRIAYTWIDTVMSPPATFLTPKPFRETFSRTVNKARLLAAAIAKTPIVCSAVAIDLPDSNVSEIARCTLYVRDTISPAVTLLSPPPNASDTIKTLPLTIKALVTDLTGINSVTFNGSAMTYDSLHKDTALISVSALDTGKNVDSIVALDNAGNRSKLTFPLIYKGKQLYRPEIKDLSKATPEIKRFDTLFLDTCVSIKDPDVVNKPAFIRDSLTWLVTDSAGGQIAVPASHKIVIPQPLDTEWVGTIKLTFNVWITSTPSLNYTVQPSFFVTEVPDKPVILLGQSWCSNTGYSDTVYLDAATTVRDPDNALTSLSWKFTPGKHFKVDSLYTSRLLKTEAGLPIEPTGPVLPPIGKYFFNRHVRIGPISAADTSYYGTDTLIFTVTDPGNLSDSKAIYFSRIAGKCLFHIPFPTLP